MRGRAVAVWVAGALGCALVAQDPVLDLLVLAASIAVVAACAGLRRSRSLLLAVAVAALMATLLTFALSHVGATVLLQLPGAWPLLGGPWTLEALAFGAQSGIVLAAAVLSVAPLSLLVDATALLDALPRGLDRTGAMVASSLNLVPAIAQSARETAEAQRFRGLRTRRLGGWIEVLVPVILTSIEDSLQLAEAMEARGYGGGRRTHYPAQRPDPGDLLVAGAALLALAVVIALHAGGLVGSWQPYPVLTWPSMTPLELLPPLLLLLPIWRWRRSPSTA
ncbi:MAG: energy-coupling factor transporter transmembrane component T [Candidatus Dormibacteraceae bacterium]